MTPQSVYIAGAGIISPLGSGLAATEQALRENCSAIKPLDLFSLLQGSPLPVGQADALEDSSSLPRTHQLALAAAAQAMEGCSQPPDAIILGTTTGGILTTEQLLRSGEQEKELYKQHGLHSVADFLAGQLHCTGAALTVSTACSSGAVAIGMALEMLRSGKVQTVLAGGVDSLCRLTYFGFHSLQLVDQNNCKPLDVHRQGMAVAEGAAMLLLTTKRPETPCLAELLGAGLSCDAYHPAAPHPEGQGAFTAMERALADAGLEPENIDYISLHGTGTPDNDLAESKAVRRLFPKLPPLSSIKGASGHSLAAAGAIEAVVAMIAVSRNLVPANTGLEEVDPELGVKPVSDPLGQPVQAVLSNSFGFGGNNGSLVIGAPGSFPASIIEKPGGGLFIHGYSCLSGAGNTAATLQCMQSGSSVAGQTGLDIISENLPPRLVRRLKRLPRMTLSLAAQALERAMPGAEKCGSVFMGTGWGALSETYDFLTRLTESNEQFPSPIDFVGSVHNGPASQVAIMFGATGPNITTSGGDYSFEQALLAADLMLAEQEESALILGVDEGHEHFSPLFDSSALADSPLADGGAAFSVSRKKEGALCRMAIPFYQRDTAETVVAELVESLAGAEELSSRCPFILVGIPAAMKKEGEQQLEEFMALSKFSVPVFRYRECSGEFASASALAAAFAVSFFEAGTVPGKFAAGNDIPIDSSMNTILVLGLGQYLTAMEFSLV